VRRQDNAPIKVIIQRFHHNLTSVEEKVRIIEFLIVYSRIEDGAMHLMQENILKSLSISSLMNAMNEADFYI
jgi:hypothetical protein